MINDLRFSDVIKYYEEPLVPIHTFLNGKRWDENDLGSEHLKIMLGGGLSVIRGIDLFTPDMRKEIGKVIEKYPYHKVEGHLYVSVGNENFGLHTDTSETTLIQIIGTSFVTMKGETKRLTAGDTILLPFGVEHEVVSAGIRVSLSIPAWRKE